MPKHNQINIETKKKKKKNQNSNSKADDQTAEEGCYHLNH